MTKYEPPLFHPFDPDGPMRVYVRNLPHWRQPGATYFVTFRQADSIPASVLAQWLDIRQRWWKAHKLSIVMKENDPARFDQAYASISLGVRHAFEREQATMLHKELDLCHGSCVLKYPAPSQHVADALQFFDGERLMLGDFVVMPNHVHALVIPHDDWQLEDLLGSIKKYSSRQIGKWLEEQPEEIQPQGPVQNKPRFWQHESYDRIVRDVEELTRFRKYIADNPAKANLSEERFHYSAADWLDKFAARAMYPKP